MAARPAAADIQPILVVCGVSVNEPSIWLDSEIGGVDWWKGNTAGDAWCEEDVESIDLAASLQAVGGKSDFTHARCGVPFGSCRTLHANVPCDFTSCAEVVNTQTQQCFKAVATAHWAGGASISPAADADKCEPA